MLNVAFSKDKKLLKTLSFPEELNLSVDFNKVRHVIQMLAVTLGVSMSLIAGQFGGDETVDSKESDRSGQL